MIIEDIAELFTELDEGEESQTQIAKHFGRSRKFIPLIGIKEYVKKLFREGTQIEGSDSE